MAPGPDASVKITKGYARDSGRRAGTERRGGCERGAADEDVAAVGSDTIDAVADPVSFICGAHDVLLELSTYCLAISSLNRSSAPVM
jgi:hypothetical protein